MTNDATPRRSHDACDHDKTPKARAACRRANKAPNAPVTPSTTPRVATTPKRAKKRDKAAQDPIAYAFKRFTNTIDVMRRQIDQHGRAVAYITTDDEGVRNVKIYAISTDGWLDCKEFSGSEFSVRLDEVTDITL